MDVFPLKEDVIKIEPFKALPLEDNSVQSMVIDLPFVIAPKHTKSNSELHPLKGRVLLDSLTSLA